MTSWKLILGWLLALAVTTALTWQIVSFADNQVSARPVAVAPSTSSTDAGSTTSTSLNQITTTSSTATTSSSAGESTSTSSSPAPTSTSSSSSSSSAASWSVRTIVTNGGTVVVRHRPNEVELQAATPAPGFELEIDDGGPQRVRVEFESVDEDIRVDVKWDGGDLDVEVSGQS